MIAASASLLVPAPAMPMTSEVWRVSWYDHQMPDPGLDFALAPRTHIGLARLVRLDRLDDLIIETGEPLVSEGKGLRRGRRVEHAPGG
jgi:hypothetical protein